MSARVLMVQGTASSVGKSLVVTALCRVFARKGLSVAPYKSQNMSNNASAIGEGLEIGRAQALQAVAARVAPDVDMNPILLKPETDSRSQVVVLGRPWSSLGARDYYSRRDELWKVATTSLARLRERHDLVIIEGAGSPAEINLRGSDIVNMAIARHAEAPVLLVGDIDPGGVFAQFAGTLALLEPAERALVRGLVVNKFRGEASLLEPGLRMIEGIVGKPVLGVLPMLHGLGLADEDAQSIERAPGRGSAPGAGGRATALDIAVIHYPRISNFDDLDGLRLDPRAGVRLVREAGELGHPHAVILPGTKATLSDLDWLRSRGLDDGIRWLSRLGVPVLGICGGYQMLGHALCDPEGVEGPAREAPGLGLLPVRTVFSRGKRVGPRRAVSLGGPGFLAALEGAALEGYEIHSGATGPLEGGGRPLFRLGPAEGGDDAGASLPDGAASADGRVVGTYLHGLFDLPAFRAAWLDDVAAAASLAFPPTAPGTADNWAGKTGTSLSEAREEALERLADAAEAHLDMEAIERIIGNKESA